MNKKRIFSLFKKSIGFLFIALLLHNILLRNSSQVVNYKEIIKADKNYKKNNGLICQNLKDIEKIENALIAEVEYKSKQKWVKNSQLEKTREDLRKIEQECQQFQEQFEQKEAIIKEKIFQVDDYQKEKKIIDDYGTSWGWMDITSKRNYKLLEEFRDLLIKNIQVNLESNKLAINDLNTDYYIDGSWKKRSFLQSLIRDPQRLFLIQPLQFVSCKLGINISSNSLYAFFDIFFKVLIMRLILNLISYPPNFDLTESEQKRPLNNIYVLEEEKKLAQEKLKTFNQFLFNIGLILSVTFCFYFHPFAFNTESALYIRQTSFFLIIPSILFSLLSGYLMFTYYHQKIGFWEYVKKNWLMSLIIPSVIFIMIYSLGGTGNQLGRHLPILLSELINIFIYLTMIFITSKKKKKWKPKNLKI